MPNRRATTGGVPIEEAPWWARALFAVVLWLLGFPALVGLLHGLRAWNGDRRGPALAALALAVALTVGLAARRPWRRPRAGDSADVRPRFVRFATWLVTSLLYPHVLLGAVLLTRPGPPPERAATIGLGLVLSTTQAVLGWVADRRRGDSR